MIERTAESLTNLLLRNEVVERDDAEIYTYGFVCLLGQLAQFVFFALVGLLLGCLPTFAATVFGFAMIKRYIGGWHANSWLTCTLTSTTLFVVSNYAMRFVPSAVYLVLLGFAGICILVVAPIEHANNPKTPEEMLLGRKKVLLALAVETAIMLLLFVSSYQAYAICLISGFFLATITLFITTKEENTNEKAFESPCQTE